MTPTIQENSTTFDRRNLPIIVGGCQRSGTSLVRRILDSHPRIHCGPEVVFFRDFFDEYFSDPLHHIRFFNTARSILAEEDLFAIMGRAFIELHEKAAQSVGKPRWADKCPRNCLHLKEWEKLLGPNWLYLHVLRNPLDTLASMKDHPMPLTIPATLEGRIEHYRRYVESGLAWVKKNSERAMVLSYEALVTHPMETCELLMKWLGEEMEPIQLHFGAVSHQAGLEDPEVSTTQAVHARSLGAWHKKLSRAEAEIIQCSLSEIMTECQKLAPLP